MKSFLRDFIPAHTQPQPLSVVAVQRTNGGGVFHSVLHPYSIVLHLGNSDCYFVAIPSCTILFTLKQQYVALVSPHINYQVYDLKKITSK